MKDVMILTGAGQIGMAIARRMGYGMKIVIGDKKLENAQAIAKIMNDAGFDAVPVEMDLSSRESIMNLIAEAQKYGAISMLVNAAGVSPSQAPIEAILKVDLYGTAVLLEEVGKVIREGGAAGDVFYNIAFGKEPYYRHQGWLSGRITTDDNFTFYEKPELDEAAPAVPEGDFVAKKTAIYYVSVDPSGRLGWKSSTLTYSDTKAHVLEVLTEKAGNAYKAFLRKLGISYIIAGSDSLDYELAMQKLKELFGIETLMLGGGAALNWSFIQAGMCDEVSVVIAAAADGSPTTQTLFMAREGLSNETPVRFDLQSAEVRNGGSVWLRYRVRPVEGA